MSWEETEAGSGIVPCVWSLPIICHALSSSAWRAVCLEPRGCPCAGGWLRQMTLCSACASAGGISCSLVFKVHGWLCNVSTAAQVLFLCLLCCPPGAWRRQGGNSHSPFAVIYSLAACFDHVVFEPILKKLCCPQRKRQAAGELFPPEFLDGAPVL